MKLNTELKKVWRKPTLIILNITKTMSNLGAGSDEGSPGDGATS